MDCLKDWPEPVVPVQSLSESGVPAIPDQNIKPPSERPSSDSAADKNFLGIPVIDFGRLSEGAAGCRATMKAISDACRDWGFFQMVNHASYSPTAAAAACTAVHPLGVATAATPHCASL